MFFDLLSISIGNLQKITSFHQSRYNQHTLIMSDIDTTELPHPADLDDNLNFDNDVDVDTPQDLIINAAKNNDPEGIKRVLETGVNINELDWGWSALHWVSTSYDEWSNVVPDNILKGIQLLIDMGADVDVEGDMLETPLHHVANLGLFESCIVLLDNGADLDVRDKFGWTPLHYAAASGKMWAARVLVLYGADLNAHIDSTWHFPCNDNSEYQFCSTASDMAFRHKKHDTLPHQLKKCTTGEYSYNEWVKSKRSKYINLLEKCMHNIPSDVCWNVVDYSIDISRGAWLNDVWPLSVNE